MVQEPQGQATTESGEQSARKARRFSPAGVLAGATAALTAISGVLRVASIPFEETIIRFVAIGWITGGVLLLGRDAVHVFASYWQHEDPANPRWTDRRRRSLNALLVIEPLLATGLIGLGLWTFRDSAPAWCVLATAVVVGPMTWLVMSEKHRLVRLARLRRGTEVVRRTSLVRALRAKSRQAKGLPGVITLYKLLFVWRPATRRFSSLAFVVLALLGFAMIAGFAVVAPQLAASVIAPSDRADQAATAGKEKSKQEPRSPVKPRSPKRAKPANPTPKPTPTPRVSRTYEDNCGTHVRPGDGIEGRARAELEEEWRRLGEPALGCAGVAKLVKGTKDVYAVVGHCVGRFRSIGVVSSIYPAAVLIAEPAELAAALLRYGRLRGASKRQPIGAGDFQIVYSSEGSWLLIRPETTDGKGGMAGVPQRCTDVLPGGRAYVTLPPALADLWLKHAAATGRGSWPERDASRDSATRSGYTFVSDDGSGRPVARASCTVRAPIACKVSGSGVSLRADAKTADGVDVDRVRRFGPTR